MLNYESPFLLICHQLIDWFVPYKSVQTNKLIINDILFPECLSHLLIVYSTTFSRVRLHCRLKILFLMASSIYYCSGRKPFWQAFHKNRIVGYKIWSSYPKITYQISRDLPVLDNRNLVGYCHRYTLCFIVQVISLKMNFT